MKLGSEKKNSKRKTFGNKYRLFSSLNQGKKHKRLKGRLKRVETLDFLNDTLKKVNRSKFGEALLWLGVLNVINILWVNNNLGFIGVSPHPYWIVILAMAIKYEYLQAITTSILTILNYSIFLVYTQNIESLSDYFFYDNFKPVLLFLIVGSILGQIRSKQNKIHRKTLSSNKRLSESLKHYSHQVKELTKVKEELSERIVNQDRSVSTVYQLFKKINFLNEDEMITSSLNFVKEVIGANKCSFHLYEDGVYKMKGNIGWQNSDLQRYSDVQGNDLVVKAAKAKDIRAMPNYFDTTMLYTPEMLENTIVVSAPVLKGDEKQLYGAINIEEIPFIKFNSDAISHLSILTDWLSHLLNLLTEIDELSKNAEIKK